MADVTPGAQTSEGKLASKTAWLSIAVVVLGGLTQVLTELQLILPSVPWLGGALMALGLVIKVLNSLGYGKARSEVKAASLSKAEVTAELSK